MKIKSLPCLFSISKVNTVEPGILNNKYVFISRTDEEISLVCPTNITPLEVTDREDGYRGYRIEGMLDFSLIGIIADISSSLAEGNIPIFVISTFNTDYFFIKNKYAIKAMQLLKAKGYEC